MGFLDSATRTKKTDTHSHLLQFRINADTKNVLKIYAKPIISVTNRVFCCCKLPTMTNSSVGFSFHDPNPLHTPPDSDSGAVDLESCLRRGVSWPSGGSVWYECNLSIVVHSLISVLSSTEQMATEVTGKDSPSQRNFHAYGNPIV